MGGGSEEDELEAQAAATLGVDDQEGPALHDAERCPACNRPLDDIEGMGEETLLAQLRVNLLKDLLRGFMQGTITHQEKAILRGLLRDNKSVVPTTPGGSQSAYTFDDEVVPERRTPLPSQRDLDETNGG